LTGKRARARPLPMQLARALDIADYALCRVGLRRFARWEDALASRHVRLYAGKLRRGLPQFESHFGITPFYASSRNIPFDATARYPIPDGSVDVYQSEDVFEHIPLDKIVPLFDEIHRVLRPGGLFRLSLPDYGFDLYRDRTLRDENGAFLFDPGGGGRLDNGAVVDGGHLWFPTIELVEKLFEQSAFHRHGTVRFLHYNRPDGTAAMEPIDYSLGHIQRTPDHDTRVADRPRPLSIVVDAIKA
jgi:SAM-dependent methyltransferase